MSELERAIDDVITSACTGPLSGARRHGIVSKDGRRLYCGPCSNPDRPVVHIPEQR